jgi:hypothetical protein
LFRCTVECAALTSDVSCPPLALLGGVDPGA